jgi:hypothetical protein
VTVLLSPSLALVLLAHLLGRSGATQTVEHFISHVAGISFVDKRTEIPDISTFDSSIPVLGTSEVCLSRLAHNFTFDYIRQ